MKNPASKDGVSDSGEAGLHVERGTTAAGALHVRIFELETRAFQRFDIIDACTLQVHERGRINKNLQAIELNGKEISDLYLEPEIAATLSGISRNQR